MQAKLEGTERALRVATGEIATCVERVIWSAPETLRLLQDFETAVATQAATWAAIQVLGPMPLHLQKHAIINHPADRAMATAWQAWRVGLEADAAAAPPPS